MPTSGQAGSAGGPARCGWVRPSGAATGTCRHGWRAGGDQGHRSSLGRPSVTRPGHRRRRDGPRTTRGQVDDRGDLFAGVCSVPPAAALRADPRPRRPGRGPPAAEAHRLGAVASTGSAALGTVVRGARAVARPRLGHGGGQRDRGRCRLVGAQAGEPRQHHGAEQRGADPAQLLGGVEQGGAAGAAQLHREDRRVGEAGQALRVGAAAGRRCLDDDVAGLPAQRLQGVAQPLRLHEPGRGGGATGRDDPQRRDPRGLLHGRLEADPAGQQVGQAGHRRRRRASGPAARRRRRCPAGARRSGRHRCRYGPGRSPGSPRRGWWPTRGWRR